MRKYLLWIAVIAVVAGCAGDLGDSWYDPVIPVSLVGIEAVNVDNSGEFPFVSASPIRKEAFMIGVIWITDHVISDDDKFITGPIQWGEQTRGTVSNRYSKAVRANTQFNSSIPAGTYVSRFFKEINRNFLPTGIDEGFVLLLAPDPGEHSFRVEYWLGNTLAFYYDTPPINFF